MELVSIGDGLYAYLQEDKGLGWSNSGLIADGPGLVVDSLYDPTLTRRMLDRYAEVHPEPVATLVNTHHNGDHCWGNQCFAGAEIIAHSECAARFDEFPPELAVALVASDDPPEHMADLVAAFAEFDFADVELTPPTRTIDDSTELDVGGRLVELVYVGPAHTAGDLLVHVPDAGVVYAGDILFHLCTPIGWEGTHQNWVDALALIESLEPEHVVAGHGPLCGVEGVVGLRRYLEYVWDEAQAHHEAGRIPLDACLAIELGPYAEWTEPERLATNVHRVYRELDGWQWFEAFDLEPVFRDMAALRRHYGA